MGNKRTPAAPPPLVTDEPAGAKVPNQVDPKIKEAAERTIEKPIEEVEAVVFGPHSGKYLIKIPKVKDSPKDEDIRKMVVYKRELGYKVKITDKRLIKAMEKEGHKVFKEEK